MTSTPTNVISTCEDYPKFIQTLNRFNETKSECTPLTQLGDVYKCLHKDEGKEKMSVVVVPVGDIHVNQYGLGSAWSNMRLFYDEEGNFVFVELCFLDKFHETMNELIVNIVNPDLEKLKKTNELAIAEKKFPSAFTPLETKEQGSAYAQELLLHFYAKFAALNLKDPKAVKALGQNVPFNLYKNFEHVKLLLLIHARAGLCRFFDPLGDQLNAIKEAYFLECSKHEKKEIWGNFCDLNALNDETLLAAIPQLKINAATTIEKVDAFVAKAFNDDGSINFEFLKTGAAYGPGTPTGNSAVFGFLRAYMTRPSPLTDEQKLDSLIAQIEAVAPEINRVTQEEARAYLAEHAPSKKARVE